MLDKQHDAHVLDDGHITVFDNGMDRKWSRVVEMDPSSGEIVWTYGHPDPDHPQHFFSDTRGSAEILPNGNALVACSNRGWAFEVTRDGRRVWSFFNPHRNREGHRAVIMRIRHYDREFIDSLLQGSTGYH